MKKQILILLVFIFTGQISVFASLVGALNDISNQIDSSGSGSSSQPSNPSAQNQPPRPPVPPPSNLGNPLSTTQDPTTGNSSSTYKNPDGSYTLREMDASGNVVSEKKFGGPNSGSPALNLGQGSTMVNVAPDGTLAVRKLADGSAIDTTTGVTTSVRENADGTRKVVTTDRSGNVISSETRGNEPVGGSAFDPQTGRTTSSIQNQDGTRTVTTTDGEGNVVSTEKRGREPVGGSAFDPTTGITTSSIRQADGSRLVTQTDESGKVISQQTRR